MLWYSLHVKAQLSRIHEINFQKSLLSHLTKKSLILTHLRNNTMEVFRTENNLEKLKNPLGSFQQQIDLIKKFRILFNTF